MIDFTKTYAEMRDEMLQHLDTLSEFTGTKKGHLTVAKIRFEQAFDNLIRAVALEEENAAIEGDDAS